MQILRDAGGRPDFAVPFADYQTLIRGKAKVEPGIPAAVVDLAMDNGWPAARVWREHKELTQTEVAQRMGITQGAYAQLEARKSIRKPNREKIAKALGIREFQRGFYRHKCKNRPRARRHEALRTGALGLLASAASAM